MTLTLEQTSRIVSVNGVPGRVWEGVTGKGVRVFALITRIAVHKSADASQLEAELVEQRSPTVEAQEAFPGRIVLCWRDLTDLERDRLASKTLHNIHRRLLVSGYRIRNLAGRTADNGYFVNMQGN